MKYVLFVNFCALKNEPVFIVVKNITSQEEALKKVLKRHVKGFQAFDYDSPGAVSSWEDRVVLMRHILKCCDSQGDDLGTEFAKLLVIS